jgi:hypothetical protein
VVPADHDHWCYLDQPAQRIDRQRLVIRAGAGVIEEITGVDDGVGLKLPAVVDYRLDGCLVVGAPGLRPELDPEMPVARMDQAE